MQDTKELPKTAVDSIDGAAAAASVLVARLERQKTDLCKLSLRSLLSEVALSFPTLKAYWLPITIQVITLIDDKAGVTLPDESHAQQMVISAMQHLTCPRRHIGWMGKYLSFNSLNSYTCRSLTVTGKDQFVVGALALEQLSAARSRGGTVAVFVSPDTRIDDSTLANPGVTIFRVSWPMTARLMGIC